MKSLCYFVFFLVIIPVQAQLPRSTWDRFNDPSQGLGAATLQNSFVYGINPEASTVLGTSYYDTTWQMGSFMMFNDTTLYKGIPARYDIQRNVVEIKLKIGLRVLEGANVNSFALQKNDHQRIVFTNTQNFESGEALKGFYEMLSAGRLTLLMHHKTWTKKPTYNAALDVGNRNSEMIREAKLYYAKNGKAERLSVSKKKLLEIMQDRQKDMETYFDQWHPDLKDKATLTKVFDYYNNLH